MKKEKKLEVSGVLLPYGKINSNGRIYTKKCAAKIVEQAKEDIENGFLYGELGYPDRAEVSLGNVSHKIEEIHLNIENECIEGTIRICDSTPKGKKLLNLLDGNIDRFNELFVIRPRGTGTINEKGEVENYTLYSFDVIPKDDDAFFSKIK